MISESSGARYINKKTKGLLEGGDKVGEAAWEMTVNASQMGFGFIR